MEPPDLLPTRRQRLRQLARLSGRSGLVAIAELKASGLRRRDPPAAPSDQLDLRRSSEPFNEQGIRDLVLPRRGV